MRSEEFQELEVELLLKDPKRVESTEEEEGSVEQAIADARLLTASIRTS